MRKILLSLAMVLLVISITSLFLLSHVYFSSSPSGLATNNASGEVSIIIDDLLIISLTNDTINFGSCAINTTRGYAILDSSASNTSADNGDCIGGFFPSSLVVRNLGNVDANVTVAFNETGPSFFNDSNSWLAYKTNSTDVVGACVGNAQDNFTNITSANSFMLGCDNLSFLPTKDFSLYLKTYIDADANGGGELLVTFAAQPAS